MCLINEISGEVFKDFYRIVAEAYHAGSSLAVPVLKIHKPHSIELLYHLIKAGIADPDRLLCHLDCRGDYGERRNHLLRPGGLSGRGGHQENQVSGSRLPHRGFHRGDYCHYRGPVNVLAAMPKPHFVKIVILSASQNLVFSSR